MQAFAKLCGVTVHASTARIWGRMLCGVAGSGGARYWCVGAIRPHFAKEPIIRQPIAIRPKNGSMTKIASLVMKAEAEQTVLRALNKWSYEQ